MVCSFKTSSISGVYTLRKKPANKVTMNALLVIYCYSNKTLIDMV